MKKVEEGSVDFLLVSPVFEGFLYPTDWTQMWYSCTLRVTERHGASICWECQQLTRQLKQLIYSEIHPRVQKYLFSLGKHQGGWSVEGTSACPAIIQLHTCPLLVTGRGRPTKLFCLLYYISSFLEVKFFSFLFKRKNTQSYVAYKWKKPKICSLKTDAF